MSGEGPKFLVGDEAEMPPPAAEPEPAGPTPEQRAAIEDYLAGRSLVTAKCSRCKSAECAPVYMMLVHSQFSSEQRFRFKHGSEPVHQPYAPHVTMMCTPCYWRADGLRKTGERVRWGIVVGLLICVVAMATAFAKVSSGLFVALLFGGFAVTVISGAIANAAVNQSDKALALPRMILGGDLVTRVVSRDRAAIGAFLEKEKLVFLDPTEIDRLVQRVGG